MIELNLNGFTDLPQGKVANIATYLEMVGRPALRPVPETGLTISHMSPPELLRYKALFKAVGDDWLWFSRLFLSDEELEKTINNPAFEIFVLQKEGIDIGLLEIDLKDGDTMELAYFGLTENAVGTGAGRFMMDYAIRRTFDHHGAKRFDVHTCTMDSPQALPFYIRSGFVPYKRAIEVDDDPRLSGHIARNKAPHHPIIDD
ncbi:MAG: GNAT family N-acetyltransferase [Hyphomicrobiales bacterium]